MHHKLHIYSQTITQTIRTYCVPTLSYLTHHLYFIYIHIYILHMYMHIQFIYILLIYTSYIYIYFIYIYTPLDILKRVYISYLEMAKTRYSKYRTGLHRCSLQNSRVRTCQSVSQLCSSAIVKWKKRCAGMDISMFLWNLIYKKKIKYLQKNSV